MLYYTLKNCKHCLQKLVGLPMVRTKLPDKKLIQQLNIAYDDALSLEEKKWQESAKIEHRKLVEGQW